MRFLCCLHKGNLHNLRGHLVVQGCDQESRGSIDHMGLGCCSLLHSVKYTSFSKVPKFLGPISGATIPVISSQRRGSKPSNFAAILIHTLKHVKRSAFQNKWIALLQMAFLARKNLGTFEKQATVHICNNQLYSPVPGTFLPVVLSTIPTLTQPCTQPYHVDP